MSKAQLKLQIDTAKGSRLRLEVRGRRLLGVAGAALALAAGWGGAALLTGESAEQAPPSSFRR